MSNFTKLLIAYLLLSVWIIGVPLALCSLDSDTSELALARREADFWRNDAQSYDHLFRICLDVANQNMDRCDQLRVELAKAEERIRARDTELSNLRAQLVIRPKGEVHSEFVGVGSITKQGVATTNR